MDNSNLRALKLLGNILAGDFTLLIITTAGAEGVPKAALSVFRVCGSRRYLQDTVFGIDFSCRIETDELK